MYLLDPDHPTELLYERQEVLMREARNVRLARERRTVRRKERRAGKRQAAGFLRRAIALWGRASTPFFSA